MGVCMSKSTTVINISLLLIFDHVLSVANAICVSANECFCRIDARVTILSHVFLINNAKFDFFHL